jgi:methionyl-tRNA formyltransferase
VTQETSRQAARIGVFGCGFTTWELVARLTKAGVGISHCITIGATEADRQLASGYVDLVPRMAALGVDVLTVDTYSLSTEADRCRVSELELDLGLCVGWQRLLPQWCLDSVRRGVFGMHGSNRPLPHGRGRSPLNWSITLNKQIFFTHLFKYDAGVDTGQIVDMQRFDINHWDTIYSLHMKNIISMSQMLQKHLPNLLDGSITLYEQPTLTPSYYPKRSDEDGRIYWSDSTIDIFNLVRATGRPYPGAWTFREEPESSRLLRIWDACPFDSRLEWPSSRFGEIVEVFANGTFVVTTGDGSLYVREYDGYQFSLTDIGTVLHSSAEARRSYDNIPT